jgi:hypothetical protein
MPSHTRYHFGRIFWERISNIEVARSGFFPSSFPARPAGGDIPCSMFDIHFGPGLPS